MSVGNAAPVSTRENPEAAGHTNVPSGVCHPVG